jgi:hypothetical protein
LSIARCLKLAACPKLQDLGPAVLLNGAAKLYLTPGPTRKLYFGIYNLSLKRSLDQGSSLSWGSYYQGSYPRSQAVKSRSSPYLYVRSFQFRQIEVLDTLTTNRKIVLILDRYIAVHLTRTIFLILYNPT